MNNRVICPEDGMVCDMTDDGKKGRGCWYCPKIQKTLEKINNAESGDEVDG